MGPWEKKPSGVGKRGKSAPSLKKNQIWDTGTKTRFSEDETVSWARKFGREEENQLGGRKHWNGSLTLKCKKGERPGCLWEEKIEAMTHLKKCTRKRKGFMSHGEDGC